METGKQVLLTAVSVDLQVFTVSEDTLENANYIYQDLEYENNCFS